SRLPVPGLHGSLSLQIRADGPLRAPTASFDLRSPGLTLPGVKITSLAVQAQAHEGEIDVQQLAAATSLGDVTASGALRLPPGGPPSLRIAALTTSHAGLDLALAAPVEIARDGAHWRCDGAELSGSAGALRVSLGSDGAARQTFALSARALRPVPLLE